jgi:DNA-binding CsgD family transcriptional regulator
MPDVAAFQFYSKLRQLETPAACADLFRDAILPFGFNTFACGEVDLADRDRNVFYIVDWPEAWRRFYVGSGLVNRDPVVGALDTKTEPFTWSDLRKDGRLKDLGRVALDLCAAEGWTEGFVVPLPRGYNRVGLVSLVGHGPTLTPEARAFLTLISLALHTHVRSLIPRQGFAEPPAGLTAREIACLRLVALGLSDAAVAKTLGIATSTAHEFVEKAKRRLKCRSRTQMVAVAVSLGIIDL